jgi:hypothetical protein
MESVFLNIVSAWLAFNAAFVTTLVAGASARPRQSAKILPFVAPKKRRVNDRMLGIVPTGLPIVAEATACASTSSSV